jgi:hypothetical protein
MEVIASALIMIPGQPLRDCRKPQEALDTPFIATGSNVRAVDALHKPKIQTTRSSHHLSLHLMSSVSLLVRSVSVVELIVVAIAMSMHSFGQSFATNRKHKNVSHIDVDTQTDGR